MKIKLSLFLILSAISFFTYAEEPKSDWTNYAESSKSGFKIYYSKSSVKKDGEFCTVKILKNFNFKDLWIVTEETSDELKVSNK